MSSLPEGEWVVAGSQRGMTQDQVKSICQGAAPWKTGIFLKGRVEVFTKGWASWCWLPKRDDAGWSEISLLMCNALKNEHLPERKGWALYRRVSELVLSPKEGDAGNEKNDYKTDERNRKGKYKHLFWCNLIYKKDFSLSAKYL